MTLTLRDRHRVSIFGALAVIATSVSLISVMRGSTYLVGTALGVAGLAFLGMGLRHLRVPGIIITVAQAAAAGIGLLLAFGITLRWGIVPVAESWSEIASLVRDGARAAQANPAPTPHQAGLALMLAALVLACAIAVDQVAAGLGKVPAAGLALLTLYSIPAAAVTDGIPLWGFIPGAAAFIALLLASEFGRLSRWGRVIDRDGQESEAEGAVSTAPLSQLATRLGAIAILVSVVGAFLIPTLDEPWGGEGDGPGPGGNISFANPLVSVSSQLQQTQRMPLMTVRGGSPEYVRMAVLDDVGPDGWRVDTIDLGAAVEDIEAEAPQPPGWNPDALGSLEETDITLLKDYPRDTPWLPMPFLTQIADLPRHYGYLGDTATTTALGDLAAEQLGRPAKYSVTYGEAVYTREMLEAPGVIPDDIAEQYLDVPTDLPLEVRDEAAIATSGATDPYTRARMLETYFRNDERFTYDLDANYGYGYEAMATFLESGRGFCQQFAATMAMMARVEGIPSRIVVGFLRGTPNADGTVTYTNRDLHAWPELYFPRAGWVRFEPTPGNGATVPPWAPLVSPEENNTPDQTTATTTTSTPTAPTATVAPPPEVTPTPEPTDSGTRDGGGDAVPGWVPWSVLVVIVVVLLAALPRLIRSAQRRSRLDHSLDVAAAAEDAWWEVRCLLIDLRLPWPGEADLTVRRREREIAVHLSEEDERAALLRLALAVERARFAAGPAGDLSQIAADARKVEAGLCASVAPAHRRRALWWPRSIVRRRLPERRSVGRASAKV